MASDTAAERAKRELKRVAEQTSTDLDRVELLSAALGAFSQPVPDYEPGFQHVQDLRLNAYELDAQIGRARKTAAAKKRGASKRRSDN
jgi:hypothetical protein